GCEEKHGVLLQSGWFGEHASLSKRRGDYLYAGCGGPDALGSRQRNNINYVTGASYGPDNALTGFISGQSSGFAGMTSTFSYNKRLQPVNMSATSPAQTVFSIGYDFHLGSSNAVRKTSACRLWRIIAWRVTPMTLPATCSMTACTSTAMTRRAASARWINPQHVISFPGSSCVGIRHPLQA